MSTPESVRARLKPDPDEAARRKGVGDDVERLVAALAASGISITPDDAYAAWRRHSKDRAAGWLILYENDAENRDALLEHLDLET